MVKFVQRLSHLSSNFLSSFYMLPCAGCSEAGDRGKAVWQVHLTLSILTLHKLSSCPVPCMLFLHTTLHSPKCQTLPIYGYSLKY